MAVYDDPANGLHPADGNGAPGAEAETDAAAVASVADSDSCGSDAEELEDREAAAATHPHTFCSSISKQHVWTLLCSN